MIIVVYINSNIYVNKIYTLDGNTLIRQFELNNYDTTTSIMISYLVSILIENTYTNIPITNIIKTYIPNGQFISNTSNLLNINVSGGYYICFNISFTVDTVGINTIFFSIDGVNEKKRIDVNITNNTYTIDIFQFMNIFICISNFNNEY